MTGLIDTVVGLDIGTTASKALIRRLDDGSSLVVRLPTPWQNAELPPTTVLRLAIDLIGTACETARSAWAEVAVRAVSVGGIGESGVLLDPAGRTLGPVIAWFDRRGQSDVDDVRRRYPAFVERFPGITGLPWTFQATIAKLRWRRPVRAGSTWLNVPEWIVYGLGGDRCREPSLASRTGLIDQGSGRPWADALAVADLPEDLLPDAVPAGWPVGHLRHDDVPACAAGAVLSVAGHDHPVAALGVGAVGPDDVFNSSGTADVLARSVPGTLSGAQRQAVVDAGWSAGRHVLPDTSLLLAGVSGGLLLRRVLAALGAETEPARTALDHASLNTKDLPPGLSVTGDGRRQDDVVLRIQDGATPAAIWAAAVCYTTTQASHLLGDIEKVVGPHRRAVAAGGWTRMASVRAAKAAVLGALSFSTEIQPGVTGAALLATRALEGKQ